MGGYVAGTEVDVTGGVSVLPGIPEPGDRRYRLRGGGTRLPVGVVVGVGGHDPGGVGGGADRAKEVGVQVVDACPGEVVLGQGCAGIPVQVGVGGVGEQLGDRCQRVPGVLLRGRLGAGRGGR